ncbi:hypothetical protein [Aestuariivita sp.]|jgi:LDH2 family malate/lactate/ureidoglycolate dehydrogenase|uniref:hypothetical protein n=1 Tax=Aestuariivita sp. TaxID=1872407 RepID=UPI00216FA1EC|nr:hypothetical protein [Aestuariivita sp.]MCE8007555.1 hypothetical protein [Aestuariivita sp.]
MIARAGVRSLGIALAGLVGIALVAETGFVTALRSGMSSTLSDRAGKTRTVVAGTAPFASAVPIEQTILDAAPSTVAFAER